MRVHMHDGTQEIPQGSCLLVTRDGFMMKQRNNWVDAVVPIKSIQAFAPLEPRAQILLPKIPATVFAQAVLFFYAVYEAKKTEAAVLLHYRSENQDWMITVPQQTATGSNVSYDAAERVPGYLCVGTMHSHCAMGAFHSATDKHDESGHDGIHMTIGRLDKFPLFEMDGEVIVNEHSFEFPYQQVRGLRPAAEPPKGPAILPQFRKPGKLYSLTVAEQFDWEVPDEWVARVKERTWLPKWKVGKGSPPAYVPEESYDWFNGWYDFNLMPGQAPVQERRTEGPPKVPDDTQ